MTSFVLASSSKMKFRQKQPPKVFYNTFFTEHLWTPASV